MLARSGDMTVLNDINNIDRHLSKIGLTRSALLCTGEPKVWLNGLKKEFGGAGQDVPFWFSLGFWCYGITGVLAEKGEHFEQSVGRSLTTEDARHFGRTDAQIRKAMSNFLAALTDAGWSPDDAENFGVEKVYPFLWSPDQRKWAFRPEMGPMQDLAFLAREKDTVLTEFWPKRLGDAAKAFMESIPIVGKGLSILIFGGGG